MEENYYINKNGVLKRKADTVYFIRKNEAGEIERRILPVEKIRAIFAYGRISFTSGVVSHLAKTGVPIHFFNYYGFYESSLYPREKLLSGNTIINQAKCYLDSGERLALAKEFVRGSGENIVLNLQYYSRTGSNVEEELHGISSDIERIEKAEDIPQLMSVEGSIWNKYYNGFNKFVPEKFRFDKRVRNPPDNMINCLISFGNSLLYSTVLTEIYNTQLNPTISYLHEPGERRFSLSLDISEVFKPIIASRIIFKLINKDMIGEENFVKELNSCLLNESGRRLFLQNYDEKLKTTIKHRDLGRNVSYQHLIQLECYKLIKHILGVKKYKALRMWW